MGTIYTICTQTKENLKLIQKDMFKGLDKELESNASKIELIESIKIIQQAIRAIDSHYLVV